MKHLPECTYMQIIEFTDGSADVSSDCICDALRACEQRTLDAAREAVDALPKMKIAGNFPLCDIDEVLAAIDDLRGEK